MLVLCDHNAKARCAMLVGRLAASSTKSSFILRPFGIRTHFRHISAAVSLVNQRVWCGSPLPSKERLWKAITADAVEKRKQDDLEKAWATDQLQNSRTQPCSCQQALSMRKVRELHSCDLLCQARDEERKVEALRKETDSTGAACDHSLQVFELEGLLRIALMEFRVEQHAAGNVPGRTMSKGDDSRSQDQTRAVPTHQHRHVFFWFFGRGS